MITTLKRIRTRTKIEPFLNGSHNWELTLKLKLTSHKRGVFDIFCSHDSAVVGNVFPNID